MITGIVFTIITRGKEALFEKGFLSKVVSKVLSTQPFGRIVFQILLFIKKFSLRMSWSQNAVKSMGGIFDRAVEYPWVIKQLSNVTPSSTVLDVGCSESLLSHELLARGFKVVGLDLRDYPLRSSEMVFVQRNVTDTGLPNDKFEAIILVSTIEHIGLDVYKQLDVEDDGDIRAMRELRRILSPTGVIILTTPYIGKKEFAIWDNFERLYNRDRLGRLIEGFDVLVGDYFYLKRIDNKLTWIKMKQEEIDKQQVFEIAGLACLVLKKT